MSHFSNLGRSGLRGFVLSFLVAGTWLSGCGDDPDPAAPPASGGKGGSAGSAGSSGKAGSAGTSTGGGAGTSTGGGAGTSTGGSAGTTTGGSAGTTTGGSSGSGGEGGGEGGMTNGGEGGVGAQGGEPPVGGEGGGTTSPMCISANFSIEQESTTAPQDHDHLPLGMALRAELIDMINTGAPLVLTLPEDGNNDHDHTLTFTAQQLTTLRNGGALAMGLESSEAAGNQHTHTYTIECEP